MTRKETKGTNRKREFPESCEKFNDLQPFDQMFYVVHTPNAALQQTTPPTDKIRLLLSGNLSQLSDSCMLGSDEV